MQIVNGKMRGSVEPFRWEFSVFKRIADADVDKAPNVTVVDGAQEGTNDL